MLYENMIDAICCRISELQRNQTNRSH